MKLLYGKTQINSKISLVFLLVFILLFLLLFTEVLGEVTTDNYSKKEIDTLLKLQDKKSESTLKDFRSKELEIKIDGIRSGIAKIDLINKDQDVTLETLEQKIAFTDKWVKGEKQWVDSEQKAIDRRLDHLTLLVAVIGISITMFGAIFPYLFAKKSREAYEEAEKQAVKTIQEIKEYRDQAKSDTKIIEELKKTLKEIPPDKPMTPKQKAAAKETARDLSASERDRLVAMAWEARSRKEWEKAVVYWRILANLYPHSPDLLFNLGYSIYEEAKDKDKEEKVKLLIEAMNSYREALRYNPLFFEALNNWGIVLFEISKIEKGKKREHLLDKALKKCKEAESIKVGSGSYNISCIFALKGEPEKSKRWLFKAKENDYLPSCKHLKQDSDLDSLREIEWFKDFLKEVCGG